MKAISYNFDFGIDRVHSFSRNKFYLPVSFQNSQIDPGIQIKTLLILLIISISYSIILTVVIMSSFAKNFS